MRVVTNYHYLVCHRHILTRADRKSAAKSGHKLLLHTDVWFSTGQLASQATNAELLLALLFAAEQLV